MGEGKRDVGEGKGVWERRKDSRQERLFSKLDTTGELLEQRRAEKEKPTEVVGFSEGSRVTEGLLARKIGTKRAKSVGMEVAEEAKR